MRALWVLLLVVTCGLLRAEEVAKNIIWLHQGKLKVAAETSWVIIAHRPSTEMSALGFQLHENKAEDGTPHSTNLAITTYDVRNLEALLSFNTALLAQPKAGEVASEYAGWSIRRWQGTQQGVEYIILDARTVNAASKLGLHIRLAWPLLAGNPDGYNDRMTGLLNSMIEQVNRDNPAPSPQGTEPDAGSGR